MNKYSPNQTQVKNEANTIYEGLNTGEIGRNIHREATEAINKASDDNYLENNKCWDEMNQLYGMGVVTLRTHSAIAVVIRNKNFMERITDFKRFTKCARALMAHIRLLHKELNQIFNLHKERTGGAKTHEEVIESIDIFNMYNLFTERNESVLVPTSLIIGEMLEEAETKMNEDGLQLEVEQVREQMNNFILNIDGSLAAPKLTPEQDPNVVTDVTVK